MEHFFIFPEFWRWWMSVSVAVLLSAVCVFLLGRPTWVCQKALSFAAVLYLFIYFIRPHDTGTSNKCE